MTYDETFADAITLGNLPDLLTELLEEHNAACRKYPNNSRDAGVINPSTIVTDPFRLIRIEPGYAIISGGGVTEARVPFEAGANICQWSQMEMLDHFPHGLPPGAGS